MDTRSVLILFSVAAVCSGLNIELKIKNDPQCKSKGSQCSADLKQILYCTEKGGDSWVITNCPKEQKCVMDGENYICSRKDPQKNVTFTCPGNGFFPDPYYCRKGYMCSSEGSLPEMICECPKNSALNIYQFSCITDENYRNDCKCDYYDRCKDGWMGSLGDMCQNEFYYQCESDGKNGTVALIKKCPDGQAFHEGRCQETSIISDLNSSPVIRPNCVPMSQKYCFHEGNKTCKKKGEMLPHSLKRCYYYCNAKNEALVRDCGPGSSFVCKNGTCGCIYDPYTL
ncbi:UNVERIFIED_CONTAM: hypothetical protein PYX00_010285 [Menopon gallinae]|uniref:Uncharacterized protein n=1 Tax=Menopon gallinae TaxID=328185 RepID=A0AAW2HFH1_9NEOP